MRLLKADGTIHKVGANAAESGVVLNADSMVNSDEWRQSLVSTDVAVVNFASVADGRGFSVVAELREDNQYTGQIYASGSTNPEQLTLAFQCGCDGVFVDDESWQRYGEQTWKAALSPDVRHSYLRYRWHAVASIWEQRQPVSENNR